MIRVRFLDRLNFDSEAFHSASFATTACEVCNLKYALIVRKILTVPKLVQALQSPGGWFIRKMKKKIFVEDMLNKIESGYMSIAAAVAAKKTQFRRFLSHAFCLLLRRDWNVFIFLRREYAVDIKVMDFSENIRRERDASAEDSEFDECESEGESEQSNKKKNPSDKNSEFDAVSRPDARKKRGGRSIAVERAERAKRRARNREIVLRRSSVDTNSNSNERSDEASPRRKIIRRRGRKRSLAEISNEVETEDWKPQRKKRKKL